MRSIYLCLFFTVCLFFNSGVGAASPAEAQTARQLHDRSSVVKIFSVKSRPSYYQPWRNYADSSSTGSGVAIFGNRILTNAHNIANQTFIQVRKQGDQRKYVAKLEIAGHECDLAILSVNDPDFFKGMSFMDFGELPHLQDKVNVLGYPVGGDNISVTEGVVSRIEPVNYSHSGRKLLAVQIDAAINPGNSGGPVVKDGKIVGLAFQGLSQSQNIGYIIPVPVIKHFLEDIEKNKAYKGFPEFSVMVMPLENPDMRKWLKMKDDDTGVMVVDIPLHEKAKNIFMENDVILEVDGVKIANDGTIPFRDHEVVFYEYLFWEKHIGKTCKLKILRDGKVIEQEYPLTAGKRLVPPRTFGELPTYYMIGGMLFLPLTVNYLDSWDNWWSNAPRELVNHASFGRLKEDRAQVVVLAQVMADELTVGYQNLNFRVVKEANGKKIKDLNELINVIENMGSGFLELKLQGHAKLVLDIEKCRAATVRIMERYRIPADRSNDLIKKQ